jgi:hypothetical protein
MGAFAERHAWLSTAPESGFVRTMTVQRREAGAVDILRGLTLKRLGEGSLDVTLTSGAELFDALADVFGLGPGLASVDAPARDALWSRLSTAHEAWVAAGRP